MNKKLLTVAVSAAFAATSMAAIAADATIYGRLSAEWVSLETSTNVDDSEFNEPGNSYFGIKVSENLGNGLSAIGDIEFAVGIADSNTASSTSARQQWVGLSGNFGTLTFGQHNGVYKSTNPDPLSATFLEARGNNGVSGGAFGHSSYISSSAVWSSPTVAGFSAQVLIADDQTSGAGGNDYQAQVQYANGPMKFWVATSEDSNGMAAGQEATLTKIGGSMSMGAMTFYLQYEDDDNGLNAVGNTTSSATTGADDPGTTSGDILFLGAKFKMGNTDLIAQWGEADYDTVNGSGNYFALAAVHNFSKTTKVYGGWRQTENDDTANHPNEADVFGVGLQVNF